MSLTVGFSGFSGTVAESVTVTLIVFVCRHQVFPFVTSPGSKPKL